MQFKSFLAAVLGFMPILFSCSKTSTVRLDEMISADGKLKSDGNFIGYGSEKVSGQAKIYLTNNKYMLKLEDFNTSNGPDLKVYLSKGPSPKEFISLGDLKSTNGTRYMKLQALLIFRSTVLYLSIANDIIICLTAQN